MHRSIIRDLPASWENRHFCALGLTGIICHASSTGAFEPVLGQELKMLTFFNLIKVDLMAILFN